MIVPTFSMSQTDENLFIKLHIPLGDLGNSALLVEDEVVYFSAPPYYLRLVLPGSVIENGETIDFEMIGCDLLVTLQKRNSGEHFEDLDLISKFVLTQKPAHNDKSPKIEVLDSPIEFEDGVLYNWFQSQWNTPDESFSEIVVFSSSFGFANARRDFFSSETDVCLPIDLPNPDNCSIGRRHFLRLQAIEEVFNAEHYLADFCEPEVSATPLMQNAPWLSKDAAALRPEFTSEDCHRLTLLADRHLPLLPPVTIESAGKGEDLDRRFLYLGLLDLLLAYCHDLYTREGEENSESAWVIVKVASSLSWLEVFRNLPDLLQSFYQCALSFPLVRNWNLCRKVQADVADLLKRSEAKSWCLFVLLEIRRFLIDYSGYYIFVELFIDDYIVWLQKCSSLKVLNDLGEKLSATRMKKSDVGLPLRQLEKLSADILERERLCDDLHGVSIAS